MTSFGFTVLHAAAVALIAFTLSRGESYRALLELGLETTNWHPILSFWAVLGSVVLLLLTTALAVSEVRTTVGR